MKKRDWLKVYIDLIDSASIRSLGRALGVRETEALGIAIRLARAGHEQGQEGVITHDPGAIARACGWDGEPGTLVSALIESGLLIAVNGDSHKVAWWDDVSKSIIDRRRWESGYRHSRRAKYAPIHVDTGAAQVRKDARIHVDKSPIHVDNSSAQERKCARIHVDTNTSQERNESRIHVDNPPIHVDTGAAQVRNGSRIHVDGRIHVDTGFIHVDTVTKNGENVEASTKSGDGPVASPTRVRARARDSSSYSNSYSANSYSNSYSAIANSSSAKSLAGAERELSLERELLEKRESAEREKNLLLNDSGAGAFAPAPPLPGNTIPRGSTSRNGVEAEKATRLPEPFDVSDEMFNFAASLGLDRNTILIEHEKFCDYYRASGKVMIDWTAAWRNWMRRANEFRKSRPKSRQQEYDDKIAAFLRIARGEEP